VTSDRPMPDKSYLNGPLEISINTERRLRALPPDRPSQPDETPATRSVYSTSSKSRQTP
jgi:hypothetical protein